MVYKQVGHKGGPFAHEPWCTRLQCLFCENLCMFPLPPLHTHTHAHSLSLSLSPPHSHTHTQRGAHGLEHFASLVFVLEVSHPVTARQVLRERTASTVRANSMMTICIAITRER